MIEYIQYRHTGHLREILSLQEKNLKSNLSDNEKKLQGFVTLSHTVQILENMCGNYPHICAVENDVVVGYALVTLPDSIEFVPALRNLVENVNVIKFNGKNIDSTDYLIMGQVCIDSKFRGKGIFRGLYEFMRKNYSIEFPYLVTEISTSNFRSLRAHESVGFREIRRHKNELDEWVIVLWDWS